MDVSVCVFMDVIPGYARKSMIVKNIMPCVKIQHVLFKVQKCKIWPHHFSRTQLFKSVMSPILAFKIFLKKQDFLIHEMHIFTLHNLFWNLMNPMGISGFGQ